MRKKLKLVLLALPLMVSSFINVYFAFVLQNVIDITSKGAVAPLIAALGFALFYLVMDIAVSIGVTYISGRYIQSELENLKNNAVEKSLYNQKDHGLSGRLALDTEAIERDYLRQQISLIYNVTQIIFALIAIIYISFVLTLGIALVTMLPVFLPLIFKDALKSKKEKFLDESKVYTNFLQELEDGRHVISDFALENTLLQRHKTMNHNIEVSRFSSKFLESAVDVLATNLGMLTFLVALGLGSYYVIIGKMTFGLMIASVQLMNSIVQPLNRVSYALNRIHATKGVYEQYAIIDVNPTVVSEKMTGIYSIEFDSVSYTYPDGTLGLDNFSAIFESNKSYALMGESGVGKSTVLKLISADITPDQGHIKINGQAMDLWSKEERLRHMAIARQDVHLFNDSLIHNITLWSDDNNHDVDIWMEKMSLEVLEDEKLLNNGSGLSGGQKQRIGIIRALHKKADVLLMDEVTASLDQETATKVVKEILSCRQGIQIHVTHNDRLKSCFDEVINLKREVSSSDPYQGQSLNVLKKNDNLEIS